MTAHPTQYKECRCGSAWPRRELKDAAGIFCCYVCDCCEEEKRKEFNPDIFEPGTAYSMSGEEEDIYD